ncbi:hypothetical protein DL768_004758 [Monosporascus sp. mg162]|nr:hypothetical protein DL768_004758 [Monosporascus sp. mg162]
MPQHSETSQVRKTLGDSRREVVETKNFRRVLEFFDEEGSLKDPNTRIEIRFNISLEKNLSVMNNFADALPSEHHKHYTVLPRCGHGFGYRCVTKEVIRGVQRAANPVFCESNPLHFETPEIFYGYDSVWQRDDVKFIRKILSSTHRCGQCDETVSIASFEERLPGLPLGDTTIGAADMDGSRPEGILTRPVSELTEDITFAAAWVVEHIDDR